MADPDKARIARVRALNWADEATRWELRGADLLRIGDKVGSADCERIAEHVRTAAYALVERTQ